MLNHYFEERLDPSDPLLNWKKRAWDRLEWQDPKKEPSFLKGVLFPSPVDRGTLSLQKEGLTFVDGMFAPEFSSVSPDIVALSLEQAMRPYGIFLQNRLSRTIKEESDPLALLNASFQEKGAFLYVPPRFKGELTIRFFYTQPQLIAPRLMLYLGRSAKLEIVQKSFEAPFCNSLVDLVLDEGAFCHFEHEKARGDHIFQSLRASLKRDARLDYKGFFEGGSSSRLSWKVQLVEENSEATLLGLSRLDEARHQHVDTVIEHLAPHTRSRQHFKSVLKGKSRSHFEGKIYVHPSAQKTEAYQLNNTLLLSDEAIAYAKPNLEILADDVKASHGATMGQLDEEELFYLRSRGMPKHLAEECLIEGFCRL